ncbi:MAG: methyl-accepting chemotaxis protein [Ilumatobacteraceae bacterium]
MTNLSVARRLSLVVGIALAALLGFAGLSMKTLSELRIGSDTFASIEQNSVLLADVLPPPAYLVETSLESYRLVAAAEAGDDTTVSATEATLLGLEAAFRERHAVWTEDLVDETSRQLLLTDAWDPGVTMFDLIENELVPAVDRGDVSSAKRLLAGPIAAAYAEHRAAVDAIVERTSSLAGSFEADALETASSRMWQLWLLLGLAVTVASALCFVVTGTIVRPGRAVAGALDAVAAGDLSQRVDLSTSDELGSMARSLNHALDSLGDAMGTIDAHAGSLASASEELTAVSSQLVEAATGTAGRTETMSSAAGDVTANVARSQQAPNR